MRSFVQSRKTALRDLAVISVMGSRGAPNAVSEITRLAGRTPLFDMALRMSEVEDGSMAGRLQAFACAVEQAEVFASVVARQAAWSNEAVQG